MPPIDGNPVDIATIAVAFLYASFRAARQTRTRTLEHFISDLSYGLSIFPLLLLSCVAFSSKASEALMQSNKIIMSMAGVIALVVTVRRSFEKTARGNGIF